MVETPAEYIKNIDKKRKEAEKNRDKLIQAIEKYELVDERYKAKTKQEIMANFAENEKAEKESKRYKVAEGVTKEIGGKQEKLEKKREELGNLIKQREEVEKNILGNRIEGEDVTTLELKQKRMIELNNERKRIITQIEDLEKEINNMEQELEKIKEKDREKKEKVEEEIGESEKGGKEEKSVVEIKSNTLKDNREKMIRDLWSKDREVNAIIEILGKDRIGIDKEIKERIKREVWDKYIEYDKMRRGDLKLEIANFLRSKIGNIEKKRREIDAMPEGEEKEKKLEEMKRIEEIYGENTNKRSGKKTKKRISKNRETMRKNREKKIMKWYEKKLNRDILLEVMSGIESLVDKKEEIIREFHKNFEEAIGDEGYKESREKNKEIIRIRKRINDEEKARKNEKKVIEDEMLDIADDIRKYGKILFYKGMRTNKWRKLKKERERIKEKEQELRNKKWELDDELRDIEEYGAKEELEEEKNDLNEKREKIKGKKEEIKDKRSKKVGEVKTLKEYKEKYQEIVREKKEYNKGLLEELKGLDFGVSEGEKEKILRGIEEELGKQIEKMEEGDEYVKQANGIEKRLREDWKKEMENLLKIETELKAVEEEIKQFNESEKGKEFDEIIELRNTKGVKLQNKKIDLKKQYDMKKIEISNKLKYYNGIDIDWTKEIVVEIREERLERLEREEKRKIRQQELKDFHKIWKKNVEIDEEKKEKIIQAVNRLKPMAYEEDGNKVVEFELGGKSYKVMKVNLEKYSDEEYNTRCSYLYTWMKKKELKLGGMIGDNPNKWYNKLLAEHVKKEEKKGFKIPKMEEMKELLGKLGEEACLNNLHDQIVLRMYLIGLYGYYRLISGDNESSNSSYKCRCILNCYIYGTGFGYNNAFDSGASLYLIACEENK